MIYFSLFLMGRGVRRLGNTSSCYRPKKGMAWLMCQVGRMRIPSRTQHPHYPLVPSQVRRRKSIHGQGHVLTTGYESFPLTPVEMDE